MNTILRYALFAAAGLLAGCAEAQAEPLHHGTKASAEALAKMTREGPPPESPQQRFVRNHDAEPPPSEKTPPPKKSEWAKADEATDVRITDTGCTAKRIREWYRIDCGRFVSFLGGNRESVDLGSSEDSSAWMIFPARQGDVRAAEFLVQWKWSLMADAVLSEQWLPGDPAPLITVEGIR